MKVGILTFHWAYNYGGLLQAYGLAETIGRLGHSVRFIDYAPGDQRMPWWKGWGLRSGRHMLGRALWRFRFDRFRRRRLPMTGRCQRREALREVSDDMDAVIVGSDQVWNSGIYDGFDPTYFLDFVDSSGPRRISYAACFGRSRQSSETMSKAGRLLSRFDFLSVRDNMSARLVRELCGRNPKVVVDPMLLHDYGEFLTSREHQSDYILSYYLSRRHITVGQKILSLASEKLGLPVVMIGAERGAKDIDQRIVSAGPLQWLELFQGASLVCTDSFHGTIAAVKLRKPFIAWSGLRPARIEDFLGVCGLSERLVSGASLQRVNDLLDTAIDLDLVKERVSPQISFSLEFLRQCLGSWCNDDIDRDTAI